MFVSKPKSYNDYLSIGEDYKWHEIDTYCLLSS